MSTEANGAAGPRRLSDRHFDPLYLLLCRLQWVRHADLKAYAELIAALDSPDEEVRMVAEGLLRRASPRPCSYPSKFAQKGA